MQVSTEGVSTEAPEGSGSVGHPANASLPAHQPSQSQSTYTESDIDRTVKALRTPAVYCQTFIHSDQPDFRYSAKQLEFLNACQVVDNNNELDYNAFPRNVALAAVNGFGKTERVAELVRHFLDNIPDCLVGFTSHVARQAEMLQYYLSKHTHDHFKDWELVEGHLRHPNGNRARWFTSKDAGGVESLHAPFLIRILDEVKSMDDDIIAATNRWLPKLTIFVSSKGSAMGSFYECFNRHKKNWVTIEANAYECPWISPVWIAQQREEHTSPDGLELIKSMIDNQWNEAGTHGLINLNDFNACWEVRKGILHHNTGRKGAGLDVSAAAKDGDDCVLTPQTGNKQSMGIKFIGYSNYRDLCGAILEKCFELQLDYLNVDNGGAGSPVIDMLQGMLDGRGGKMNLVRVDFGGKASNPQYANKATEMGFAYAEAIRKREIQLPDNVDLLRSQTCSRQYKTLLNGSKRLTSKADMRKEGYPSPDWFDSAILANLGPPKDAIGASILWGNKDEDRLGVLINGSQDNYSATPDGQFDLGN